jgi:hypothetical protein
MLNSNILYANENLKVNKLINSDFSKENFDLSLSSHKMLHLPTIMQTLDANIDSSKPGHMLEPTLSHSAASIASTSYQNTIANNCYNSYNAKTNFGNSIYPTNTSYYPSVSYQMQYQNQSDMNKLNNQVSPSYLPAFTTASNSKYNLENISNSNIDYGLSISPSASMPYLFSHIDSQINANDHHQQHDTHHQLLHHQTIQELNSLTNLNSTNKHLNSAYQIGTTQANLNALQRQEIKNDNLQSDTYLLQPNINSESSSSSSTSSLSSSSSINDGAQANQNDNNNNNIVDDLAIGENNAQSSKPPVIYAWMKKVHMNNGSK